ELGDMPVADQDVPSLVDPGPGIQHVGGADQQVGPGSLGREQLARAHAATAITGVPANSSYRTAIRTTTPAFTCSPIRAWGESMAAADSSIPRLTGPGCISSCPECRCETSI